MAPYLFYCRHIKTEKLIPARVSFSYQIYRKKKKAHPHMVRQKGTHGPDDNGCEAESNRTPWTPAKSMTKVFDTLLTR